MASNLYLFYSEEEFPITRSLSRTRPAFPNYPYSLVKLFFPAVWLLKKEGFYKLDFDSIESAREVLSTAWIFKFALKRHTVKFISTEEYRSKILTITTTPSK